MAVQTGVRGTGNITATTRVVDMSDKIFLLDPNMAPLTALTMRGRKQMTINPKYSWHEDEYLPDFDTVNGAVLIDALIVIVDNGVFFRAGDIVKVMDNGEVFHVDSVATDTLTVERDIGSTASAAIDDGDQLMIIGNVNEEGAGVRVIKTTLKVEQNNFTQIIRTPMAVTNTEYYSELYGGNDLTWQHKKLGKEHLIDIEMAFLFGEKSEDTSGTHPRRYTGGIIEKIVTNVTDAGGALTQTEFETFLRTGFRFGSDTKILFASRLIMSVLSGFALSNIQTRPEDKQYGIATKRWNSPHGQVILVTHNLLQAGPAGAGANKSSYSGWAILVDMDAIYYRYMRERDTHLRINIQAPDIDGRTDEYLSECGLQVIQEKNHAVLNGVTS